MSHLLCQGLPQQGTGATHELQLGNKLHYCTCLASQGIHFGFSSTIGGVSCPFSSPTFALLRYPGDAGGSQSSLPFVDADGPAQDQRHPGTGETAAPEGTKPSGPDATEVKQPPPGWRVDVKRVLSRAALRMNGNQGQAGRAVDQVCPLG